MTTSRWISAGEPHVHNTMIVCEERNQDTGASRFRLTTNRNAVALLTEGELLDLAELLGDLCDMVEDRAS